ncbi:MAG: YihY/virulence factor BrkB family protein [Pyrinomonadaceae bacterium]
MTTNERPPKGAAAAKVSAWRLGGLSWRTLLRRIWRELYEGGLLTHAAALAFYFLFALFPLLLFLATFLAIFGETGAELQSILLRFLGRIAPPSAFALVDSTIGEIGSVAGGGRLVLGLISALWLASLGIAALSESLNAMYGVHETRSWWRVRLIAIALTVVLITLILCALLAMMYGGEFGMNIADHFQQGRLFSALWSIVQVPLALLFALLVFALIYYYAPDLLEQKWYWITPGSLLAVILWVLVSALLRTYLQHFDMYSRTYGSLGAVIILMLWFYLTGAAILLGGKINAEIENAAAKAGVPDAKRRGDKEPGEHD